MLTNDRDRRTCEKYGAMDEATGKVRCEFCPLVVNTRDMMCKANSHWDKHLREWVLNELEGGEGDASTQN